MKRLVYQCLFFLLLFQYTSFAQSPGHGINYQAIARDTAGRPMANVSLDVRFTIYNDSSGIITSPFSELQNLTTTIYGLFTTVIGKVDSVEFDNINWTKGKKSLEVEIAQAGSSTFFSMGINPLVSVPYALYSKNSGNTWKLNGNKNAGNAFIGTTDSIAFIVKTNSNERIKVLANGNTGIGTSIPNARLDIKGKGDSTTSFAFGVRNSLDNYSVAVRDDGNIGFGTVLPNARVDIKGRGDNSLSYSLGVSDSTGTYAFVVRDDRRTGIGTVNPLSLLSVGTASGFQVNDSGTVVNATGITSSGTINFSSLATDGIVRATNGTGTLSSGGNLDLSNEVTGVLPVANGGSGLSSLGNWQTFYSDGSGVLTPMALGTAGTVLQSNGTSAPPSWSPVNLQQLTQGIGIDPFTYDGTAAATINIANTGVAAATYGGNLSGQIITIPNFTVNAQGQLTSATTSSFTLGGAANAANGLTLSNDTVLLGGQLIQHTDIKTKEHNISYTLDSTGNFTVIRNGGKPAFYINPSDGNIGISTTNPLGKFQVNYDTTVNFSTGPGLNSYGSIHIAPYNNIGDNAMGITFGSPDEVAGFMRTNVQAGMYVQGSGTYGTKMYFATTDNFNTGGAKTRMLIDHQGKVGIGTISPGYTLDVQAGQGTFQVKSNNIGSIATIRATNDSGNAKFVVESSSGGVSYTGSTPYSAVMGTDYFRSLHFATASNVRATILPTGEFGIGTTTPASELAVKGGMSLGSTYSGTIAAPADGAIIEGMVGIGTSSPGTSLEVNGGFTLSPSSFKLADNDTLSPGNASYIRMVASSDITLGGIGSGLKIGQVLILENVDETGNGKIKILDNTGVNIGSSNFNMNPADTITLIWNGTVWLETARSTN
jgi:hypothetical protein